MPSSRTVSPFTVTRPSSMSCSAPRREAKPARARIFWRRSCTGASYPSTGVLARAALAAGLAALVRSPALRRRLLEERDLLTLGVGEADLDGQRGLDRPLQPGHVHLLAEHLGELLDLRELLEVLEAEVEEELLRGAVEDRPAHDLLAAHDADEALLEERLHDAARLDAAQLDDLGQGDRLLVGDHGERLEGLDREPGRRARVEQLADPVVVLGARGDLVAAGDLARAAARARRARSPPAAPRAASPSPPAARPAGRGRSPSA